MAKSRLLIRVLQGETTTRLGTVHSFKCILSAIKVFQYIKRQR